MAGRLHQYKKMDRCKYDLSMTIHGRLIASVQKGEEMHKISEIKERLGKGFYDEKLAWLYCVGEDALAPLRERISHVIDGFMAEYGKGDDDEAAIFSAPGRTELGGNHTDHQRGKVLTGSVDLDALACAAPNGTKKIHVFSEGYGMISIDCGDLAPHEDEKDSTAALIRGVAAGAADKGYDIGGFDVYVISDVPGGSGLSSSACFEVLIGAVVNGLFCGGSLRKDEIAKIGQRAENVYFGKPSGLLDQMGCAMGGVVTIDFEDKDAPKYRAMSVDFADYALCIIDTGADHADLTGDYAAVPAEMKAAAAVFGKSVLREVPEEEFYANIPKVREIAGDRAVLRAIHYYDDSNRVDGQVEALEKGDFDRFLDLVNASGRSSFMYLQNIATYKDPKSQPVAVALAVAGHLLGDRGAFRVHGGGFAGTIQAFVPVDMVDSFRTGMDALLGDGACRVTKIRPEGCICLIG